MYLFVIVYERDDGCDWLFKTSQKEYLNDSTVKKLIARHYNISIDMFDECVDDYYISKIEQVDGYNIKLDKVVK